MKYLRFLPTQKDSYEPPNIPTIWNLIGTEENIMSHSSSFYNWLFDFSCTPKLDELIMVGEI